jgi:hypothetical protein
MKIKTTGLGLLVVVATLGTGCSGGEGTDGAPAPPSSGTPTGDGPSAASADPLAGAVSAPGSKLLLRSELSSGNVLEFYEPSPGHLIVSEIGKMGVDPTFGPKQVPKSPIEVFKRALPGRAVPQQLVDAEARRQALRDSADPAEVEPEAPLLDDSRPLPSFAVETKGSNGGPAEDSGDGAYDHRCPAAYFADQFCSVSGDWEVCWTNITGSSSFTRVDTDIGQTAACSYRGSILFKFEERPWYSWETMGSWTVPEGTWRWANDMGLFDYDLRSSVSNADGDGYHHGGFGVR